MNWFQKNRKELGMDEATRLKKFCRLLIERARADFNIERRSHCLVSIERLSENIGSNNAGKKNTIEKRIGHAREHDSSKVLPLDISHASGFFSKIPNHIHSVLRIQEFDFIHFGNQVCSYV